MPRKKAEPTSENTPQKKKLQKLADFRQQARNTNDHTEFGMGVLETSIQEGGFIGAMTAAANGELFAGSARLETVQSVMPEDPIVIESDGRKPIIVVRTDIESADDERAVKLGILDNRTSEANLAYNPSQMIAAQKAGAIDLKRFFSPQKIDSFYDAIAPVVTEEDDEDQVADDLEAADSGALESRVSPGEIWRIGRHKLACADSTNIDQVLEMFGDAKASVCLTDPPYGVRYVGKTEEALTIKNDRLEGDNLGEFISNAFFVVSQVCAPGSPVYVCHPAGPLQMLFIEAFNHAFDFRQQLIWVKHTFALGRSDYHYRHEPILYGFTNGGEGRLGRGGDRWFGDNAQDSVFEVKKPNASRMHPTMKPPELLEKMLKNSCGPEAIIYEPFNGSGSLMVAAQTMPGERAVFGCELDPTYCEVALRRLEKITGLAAQLEGRA